MNSSTETGKQNIVSAIARLLSDRELRLRFSKSPEAVAAEFELSDRDRAALELLDPIQLDNQAATLLSKRWHEVATLIPTTICELENARELFMFYAGNIWPQGSHRHPRDAWSFMQFLKKNKLYQPSGLELQRIKRLIQPVSS